jgi:phenylpropionate dioxygenase-like ring-hydroxylating dioxygenase large terminal subunit
MSARFPFTSFPRGWFTVAWSDEVPPGRLVSLRYFGQELVLFRTEDGEAHLLEAHCPHLGGHLGHSAKGPRVVKDCVECPFHGWRFSGDGECVGVPYAQRIPPRARIEAWPVCEKNGVILTYYDPAGKPPTWEIPDVPEHGAPDWSGEARLSWTVRSHIQELVENAVDGPHFLSVHKLCEANVWDVVPEGTTLKMQGLVRMSKDAPGGTLQWRFDGISFGVVRYQAGSSFQNLQLLMYTPIDEEQVHVRFTTILKKLPTGEATQKALSATNAETKRLFEQDIPIWEGKRYQAHPVLCPEDGQLMKYRQWAQQFYRGEGARPS